MDTSNLREVAVVSAEDELTDHSVYHKLAENYKAKKPQLAETLGRLADVEKGHYEFWKKYTQGAEIKVNRPRVIWIMLLRALLGTTFAVRFLEKNEGNVIRMYKSVAALIPSEDRPAFDQMLKDEIEHEDTFQSQLEGSAIKYISFIILGLADAIVEISGIHAGSLGVYKSTELTGLAGIVAGAAASIAMASAAYAQAKQGGYKGRPVIAAVATGLSYFVNAIVLASPYFFTSSQTSALVLSMVFATLIIAFTSYYNSVISESHFVRDFLELAGVMYGATIALYLFGLAVGALFGIHI